MFIITCTSTSPSYIFFRVSIFENLGYLICSHWHCFDSLLIGLASTILSTYTYLAWNMNDSLE